jgi:hypothetical protein
MLRLALAALLVLAALPAAAHDVDCGGELASARRAFQAQRARRVHLADPLARTVRQAIERLGDEERAVVARFAAGKATAAEVDRALWPKLQPALDRFNRAGCKDLGGVVRADELVELSTALRGGKGLHTGVVVSCARRPLAQGEARRYLGLRVKEGEHGPALTLYGFLQERESVSVADKDAVWDGLVVEVPLGDRATERAALDRALAAFTGSEDDFTWALPPRCLDRVSLAR